MQSPQKQFSNSLLQFWVSRFCIWNNLCLFLEPKCLGKVGVAGGCIPLCYEKSNLILCTNQGSLRIRICRGNTKQHFCKYRSGREQRESREWKCALPPSERAPEGESINNSSSSRRILCSKIEKDWKCRVLVQRQRSKVMKIVMSLFKNYPWIWSIGTTSLQLPLFNIWHLWDIWVLYLGWLKSVYFERRPIGKLDWNLAGTKLLTFLSEKIKNHK